MTELTDKQADCCGILRALDEFKRGMEPKDVAVVFYAGHGHGEKVDGKFFLMPHGADIDDNAPGGDRYIRLIDDAVTMFADHILGPS